MEANVKNFMVKPLEFPKLKIKYVDNEKIYFKFYKNDLVELQNYRI